MADETDLKLRNKDSEHWERWHDLHEIGHGRRIVAREDEYVDFLADVRDHSNTVLDKLIEPHPDGWDGVYHELGFLCYAVAILSKPNAINVPNLPSDLSVSLANPGWVNMFTDMARFVVMQSTVSTNLLAKFLELSDATPAPSDLKL